MGMFSSINRAITKSFDLIASTAESIEESVTAGTDSISVRAQVFKATDKQHVVKEGAKKLAAIQAELNADPELSRLYEELMKELS